MPGPTCAPRTAPSSPHQTSRPSRLASSRVGSFSASCPARSGLARWATQTSTVGLARRLDGELLEPGQRPRGGPHPLQRGDLAVLDLQQRLDRQRAAEQRGRGADPAAAAEVLQRVDVEQRRRRRGPRPGGRRRLLGGAARVERRRRPRARRTRSRPRPAGCRRRAPGSTRRARRAGPTRRCRSCRRTGGPTRSRWRRRARPSRRPRAARPGPGATCSTGLHSLSAVATSSGVAPSAPSSYTVAPITTCSGTTTMPRSAASSGGRLAVESVTIDDRHAGKASRGRSPVPRDSPAALGCADRCAALGGPHARR